MEIQDHGRLRGVKMPADPKLKGFLDKAHEVANLIRDKASHDLRTLLLSHYDADGLSAVGIIGSSLARMGANFQLRVVKELDPPTIHEAFRCQPDFVVMTDIGSGYLEALQQKSGRCEIVVIDHHPPSGPMPHGITQVNPHDFGIDGATEISAASAAYLVARSLSSANIDLSALAIVGALGDMQDKNEERRLRGPNELVVEDATKCGVVKTDRDLLFFGRETRPIHRALSLTTTPYLPGLSGEEDRCTALLTSRNIPLKDGDRWRTFNDLSRGEKQEILTAIIESLVSQGFKGSKALELIGTVYTLTREPSGSPTRDAREFSAMLNACGRMDLQGLAVQVCLGDRGQVLEEIQEIVKRYRKALSDYMRWLSSTPSAVTEFGAMCVVRGEEKIPENMTGALSSILSSAGHLCPDKVTLVAARSKDGGIKVSARAPESLLKKGADVGLALQKAAGALGGFGGGHNVAAGAHIVSSDGEEFYRMINQILSEQMTEA